MKTLKTSANSNPNLVAGAIAGVIREEGIVEIQAMGANAVNQAVKAISVARVYLQPDTDLVCQPSFVTLEQEGEQRTMLSLTVRSVAIECAE